MRFIHQNEIKVNRLPTLYFLSYDKRKMIQFTKYIHTECSTVMNKQHNKLNECVRKQVLRSFCGHIAFFYAIWMPYL